MLGFCQFGKVKEFMVGPTNVIRRTKMKPSVIQDVALWGGGGKNRTACCLVLTSRVSSKHCACLLDIFIMAGAQLIVGPEWQRLDPWTGSCPNVWLFCTSLPWPPQATSQFGPSLHLLTPPGWNQGFYRNIVNPATLARYKEKADSLWHLCIHWSQSINDMLWGK